MSVGIPVHQNTHVSWADRSTFFDQLLTRVQTMPEVVSAGISTNATPPSNGWDLLFEIFGHPAGQQQQVRRVKRRKMRQTWSTWPSPSSRPSVTATRPNMRRLLRS
jgi:hypothetical protein